MKRTSVGGPGSTGCGDSAGSVKDQGGAAEDVVHLAHQHRGHAMQAEGVYLEIRTGRQERGTTSYTDPPRGSGTAYRP